MEWESFLIKIKEGEEMEEQPVVSLIRCACLVLFAVSAGPLLMLLLRLLTNLVPLLAEKEFFPSFLCEVAGACMQASSSSSLNVISPRLFQAVEITSHKDPASFNVRQSLALASLDLK